MVSELTAYLELTPQDAAAQWMRILARKPARGRSPSFRQR